MVKEYVNTSEAGTHKLRKGRSKVDITISLRLTPEDAATIRELADREDRSVSSLVSMMTRRTCEAHRASLDHKPDTTPAAGPLHA